MTDMKWEEQETGKTPRIQYKEDSHQLSIEGKLIPEDPDLFFDKLYGWTNSFISGPLPSIELDLYLYYYNTSSLKRLSIYFEHLEKEVKKSSKNAKIIWKCDELDEDNISDGERLNSMVDLDIEVVKVAEER